MFLEILAKLRFLRAITKCAVNTSSSTQNSLVLNIAQEYASTLLLLSLYY